MSQSSTNVLFDPPRPNDVPQRRDDSLPPSNRERPYSANGPHDFDFDFDERILLSPAPLVDEQGILETERDNFDREIPSFDFDVTSKSNLAAHRLNALQSASTSARNVHHTSDEEGHPRGLHVNTEFPALQNSFSPRPLESDTLLRHSTSTSSLPRRTPSNRIKLHSMAGALSPGSTISSPQLAAMLDITPLPSPVMLTHDPWKLGIPTRSRGSSASSKTDIPALATHAGSVPLPTPARRKAYPGIQSRSVEGHAAVNNVIKSEDRASHARTRSISEYVPEAIGAPKQRNNAVSGSGPSSEVFAAQSSMHREEYLAVQRGLTTPPVKPPTPPRSTLGGYTSSEDGDEPASKRARTEIYTAQSVTHGHTRKYKAIKLLGQGTFSKVFLAIRLVDTVDDGIDYSRDSTNMVGVKLRSRRLVAVKVVEHGPAGGADEERVGVSLKREVELMKSVEHPSLVHLKAFGRGDDHQALLVLNYCPGGDLFEVASTKLEVLVPSLVRRIFSELVSAVRYLHQKYIVHRDIKLENVLLNIPIQVHSDVSDWQTLDRAVVTLTDLGLSRRIPEPPESPLLATRCGSEDYAAPELLMGQPYDGRQTDAWALGVLLYALMEGRLPFDPLPGARGDPAKLRARTPHRIARCEWAWYKFGDEDGDWDAEKGKDLEGARSCVDGLLKRSTRRKPLEEIREMAWVNDGVDVDGGLRWVEEEAI